MKPRTCDICKQPTIDYYMVSDRVYPNGMIEELSSPDKSRKSARCRDCYEALQSRVTNSEHRNWDTQKKVYKSRYQHEVPILNHLRKIARNGYRVT